MDNTDNPEELRGSPSREPEQPEQRCDETDENLDQIWKWNASVPTSINECVHDLITELAQQQPDASAVDAWDGKISYAQLDDCAGRLAYVLSSHGIDEGSIVPIYLHKSKWMPIAMLGIIKCGATAVTLDPNYPATRLRNILDQTGAKIIITSPDIGSPPWSEHLLVVELTDLLLSSPGLLHRRVSPSCLVYISFTSGTTGRPKGACMSHANVRSAIHYQGKALGFRSTTRTLDFAPYSFDVSWSNFLHTICGGGCICIAPETEMLQDLGAIIDRFRCTLVNLTPTVLRTLDSRPITLDTILLSGEAPYPENVAAWADKVRLLNTYGPTECTWKSTLSILEHSDVERPSIGIGIGMCTWLVDPDDDSQLAAVGSVGELCLEGPLVGQGYLANHDLTTASFTRDPAWLAHGSTSFPGREGLVYKTGDFARYKENGELMFVGRKDTAQVKIRGQRVEIADAEHHVRLLIPDGLSTVVDVVYPKDVHGPSLTLFVETARQNMSELEEPLGRLLRALLESLPSFMVPTLCFPVERIPLSPNGKVDRASLREMASVMSLHQLLEAQSSVLSRPAYSEPSNGMESKLRDIWSQVLGLPSTSIGANDNFLRLGGNSVLAIRMVSAARRQDLVVPIPDVLQAPTLRDLAMCVKLAINGLSTPDIEPFSLLGNNLDRDSACQAAANALGIESDVIEDILPCSPMQQGLMAMTTMHAGRYVLEESYRLSKSIDKDALRHAWLKVLRAASLLRTRIMHLPSGEVVQVVLREDTAEQHFLLDQRGGGDTSPMGLATSLFSVSLQSGSEDYILHLRIHHAIFDGWSRSLILDAVQQAYSQPQKPLQIAAYRPFVWYVQEQVRQPQTAEFWTNNLRELDVVPFPPHHKSDSHTEESHFAITMRWPIIEVTPSSIIRAALTLLMATYTNSEEVMFGATVSGRTTSLPGIDCIAGPTFAIIPVRGKVNRNETTREFLLRTQKESLDTQPYEHFGLQNISQAIGADQGDTGLFQLLLVVQRDSESARPSGLFSDPIEPNTTGSTTSLAQFNSHSMMIVCSPNQSGLTVDVSFNTACLSSSECGRFCKQFEHLLHVLCSPEHHAMKVGSLPLTSQEDLMQISEWNSAELPANGASVIDMVYKQVLSRPGAIALQDTNSTLTYKETWRLSSRIAHSLAKLDIQDCMVPICLEKSSWMAITILAVLRAGATAVPISASTASEKARRIVETCQAKLCITSQALLASNPFGSLVSLLSVEDLAAEPETREVPVLTTCDSASHDAAVIVFTSGTTNISKGIIWTHTTLNSNVSAAVDLFGLNERSKILQFAAYDFDVSIVETLSTLSAGGCVCTPSQTDLHDRLTDTIIEFEVNWICLTPSVASVLEPKQLPCVRTIVFAGEKLKPAIACKWTDANIRVINWYGPAEASVATCCELTGSDWIPGLIGRSKFARTWIIDTHDATQLVPIGAIGELCIEGDLVADGYIGNSEGKGTHLSFTTPPALQHISRPVGSAIYRTGDHVKYDSHGNIVFIGRGNDTWTKVHGKRIQLHDVEVAAQKCLDQQTHAIVAANVITLADAEYDTLVLFLCTDDRKSSDGSVRLDPSCESQALADLRRGLTQLLPGYMNPTYIIPVNRIPLGRTGKVDKRQLHRFGGTLKREQLAAIYRREGNVMLSSPITESLQSLWARVLGVDAREIHSDDHFFRLGGDSISVMRLVSLARHQNLHITTVQVFEHPTLGDMASIVSSDLAPTIEALPPFALLDTNIVSSEDLNIAAAKLCNVPNAQIENMYPATAMQQGLLALTARNPGQYVSRSVLRLQPDINALRFQQIWLKTVADLPILRTRIVDLSRQGLLQVVVRDLPMREAQTVESYLETDQSEQMGLGDALCRAALIDGSFVLTIHHSIYDGALLSMLLNKVEDKYFSRSGPKLTPFENFVKFTRQIDEDDSREFWKRQLGIHDTSMFPPLPSVRYSPQATSQHAVSISLDWPRTGNTPSTLLQSAWAVVAARLSMQTSVVFGIVLSGRDIDLPGVEYCAGPTNCTVPVALTIDWQEDVDSLLVRLRQTALSAVPHQHYGLGKIALVAGKADARDLFQALFVVHPVADGKSLQSENAIFEARSYGATLDVLGTDPFNFNALMISSWLTAQGVRLAISYDDAVLSKTQVNMLALHFERVLRNMTGTNGKTLEQVGAISTEDVHCFWSQSATPGKNNDQNGGNAQHHGSEKIDTDENPHLPQRNDSPMYWDASSTQYANQGPELAKTMSRLQFQAASILGVSAKDIEDSYPCTPLQESLIALSERRPGDYVGHDCLQLSPTIDIGRFRDAWEKVVDTTPILRTRVLHLPGQGLVQVVLRTSTPWSVASTMRDFIREGANLVTCLGQPLTRYGLVQGENDSLHFALTMHHAVYDGISNLLIRDALEAFYDRQSIQPFLPFRDYVDYVSQRNIDAETKFWKSEFQSLELEHFPRLPSHGYQPQPDLLIAHSIEDLAWRKDDILPSTVVRAAWAILCSKYTNSADAVFGAIVSGRQAALDHIDRICGPTIGMVPVRVSLRHAEIGSLLEAIQAQSVGMIPFEHTGLSRISRISGDAREACQFCSVIVIQPQQSMSLAESRCFQVSVHDDRSQTSYAKFNSHALMIICTLGSDSLSIQLSVDSSVVDATMTELIASQFANIIRQLCQIDFRASLSVISMITAQEIEKIWSWNPPVDAVTEPFIHDLISNMARKQPHAIALLAWDGQLTYQELNQLSNTVAWRILNSGMSGNQVVPICFEKSMWATVTFLGVVKAGHAVLMLEPTLPEGRIQQIVQQIRPKLVITSAKNTPLCARLCANVLTVDTTTISTMQDGEALTCIAVKPTDTLYIIYTSGSTGTPKGCMISHGNMSTSIARQKVRYPLSSSSRMYDFSAYSWDPHHWGMIHTLCAGGTLCIPSDLQRQNQLEESMRLYQATDILCTPATAKMINPASVPSMRNLVIGGDTISKEDLERWTAQARVFHVYGPSECTAWATSWDVPYPVPDKVLIGRGDAQVTWIVDTQDADRLAPIGAIGELYLEGPLVGQGYIHNEEATRASFTESPAWLTAGSTYSPGRNGRVYKTGDLVRYDPSDGNIIFVGRKDTQTKYHGRRIELEEIERHLLQSLVKRTDPPVLGVELVTPDVLNRPILVAFLEMRTSRFDDLQDCLKEVAQELSERLPSYMLPTIYYPLDSMPFNLSGKLDRRRLRDIGKSMNVDPLVTENSKADPPVTQQERVLRYMWSKVLHIHVDTIGRHSNWFRVSGDSLTAMQLMSLARRQGLSLTVSDILSHPSLETMATVMEQFGDRSKSIAVEPFSLLSDTEHLDKLRNEIARQCKVQASSVQDCYPCTAVQQSLLAITSKRPGDYIARIQIELARDVDLVRLRTAWDRVCQNSAPILRNRAVAVPGEGIVQAQLAASLEWSEHASIAEFLEHENLNDMPLGSALTRLALVMNGEDKICVLIQHHAMYDAVSLSLLLQAVRNAYTDDELPAPSAPFQDFVQHVLSVNRDRSRAFWRHQFKDCQASIYPTLPSENYQPQADATLSREISDVIWPAIDVTPATVIRAAWAILSARYTDSNDVTFGVLSTGRQVPVEGIELMIAPLIAAVPVRVKMESEMKVHALLSAMQKQSLDMIPYEQTDLAEIYASSEDARQGARYNALLVVQHAGQDSASTFTSSPFVRVSHSLDDGKLDHFNPHALMVMFQLHDSGNLGVEINFDSKVIHASQAKLLLNHFTSVLLQVCATTATDTVSELSPLSELEMEMIHKWNEVLPEGSDACVHHLFASTASVYPESPALCSWDCELTYRELDDLSTRLAKKLVARGVSPGAVIPLCFEKSIWMPVAALGAMKAGAACVAVDCTQPEGRLRSIIGKIEPAIILTSSTTVSLAHKLYAADIVEVSATHLTGEQTSGVDLPSGSTKDLLYVVFTSGSTGEPKGVTITHGNFTSAFTHQKEHLKVRHGTRVFDWVSYSFDVAWSNLLNTLLCGACLCIPSETERKNDIAGAFTRMRADYSYFTPTVAHALNPLTMPGLRTLAMGGESIPSAEIARWRQAKSVIGIYGPAECAQALCIVDLNNDTPAGHVGRAYGARTWLIEPGRPDRLAPIGAVGELVIEGPSVATGYWKDVMTTNASFLKSPPWLTRDFKSSNSVYKTGDLLRYNADGSLTFVGRRDHMVKLRGQRVELSEVEHHVQKSLRKYSSMRDTVAAEIITPSNSKSPILALFISLEKGHDRIDRTFRFSRVLEDIEEDLREALPQYMIPGAYIILDEMPMTTTNKIDRRVLREVGSQRKLEDLAKMQVHGQSSPRMPKTEMESRIQQLWAEILGIDASSITSKSSFLQIGGESIAAMRLVAAARQSGISFTVADLFRNPRLEDLAQIAKKTETQRQPNAPSFLRHKPFSLLPADAASDHTTFLYEVVEPLLGENAEADDIKDVLPATNFQELAVREALQTPPGRFPHFILDLPTSADPSRLRWACKRLTEQFDILRTVFVELQGKVFQVLLSNLKMSFKVIKRESDDVSKIVKEVCEQDLKRPRRLGQPFSAFMLVTGALEQSKLVFRLSHAQFDDHSLASLLRVLTAFYQGDTVPRPSAEFGDLISHNAREKAKSLRYWTTRLSGSSFAGRTNESAYVPSLADRLSFQKSIPLPQPRDNNGISLANLFHAACAIVLHRCLQRDDIVFGRLVAGRSGLPHELHDVVGPCLVELPIRYIAKPADDLWIIASKMQQQFIEDSHHEAAGMVDIIRNATSWPHEIHDFGWRTAFQQSADSETSFQFLGEDKARMSVFERPHPPRQRCEIYATPNKDRLELSFEGNRAFHSEELSRMVMDQVADLLTSIDDRNQI